jgi:hypothetical protein
MSGGSRPPFADGCGHAPSAGVELHSRHRRTGWPRTWLTHTTIWREMTPVAWPCPATLVLPNPDLPPCAVWKSADVEAQPAGRSAAAVALLLRAKGRCLHTSRSDRLDLVLRDAQIPGRLTRKPRLLQCGRGIVTIGLNGSGLSSAACRARPKSACIAHPALPDTTGGRLPSRRPPGTP